MKVQILFKDTQYVVTTSLEEIAKRCRHQPNELEIMRTLKEMERDNELTILQFGKNRYTTWVR